MVRRESPAPRTDLVSPLSSGSRGLIQSVMLPADNRIGRGGHVPRLNVGATSLPPASRLL